MNDSHHPNLPSFPPQLSEICPADTGKFEARKGFEEILSVPDWYYILS